MLQLLGLLTGIPSLISKGLDYYIAKANGNVQEAVTLMQADREVTGAAMDHIVWWMGWALFVFPLGVYWSKILIWDKTFGLGHTDPLTGFVADWSGMIVLSLFGLQALGGASAKVVKLFGR